MTPAAVVNGAELLIVDDLDVLPTHILDDARAGRAPSAVVCTSNLAVAEILQSRGIPFLDAWEYLPPAVIHANYELSWQLARTWTRELGDFGDEPLASLAAATTQEWIYPFEACLNAAHVYGAILDEQSVERIALPPLDPQPMWRNGPPPLQPSAASLANGVIRWLAAKRRIAVRDLTGAPTAAKRRRRAPRSAAGLRSDVSNAAARAPTTPKRILAVELGQNAGDISALEAAASELEGASFVRLFEQTRGDHAYVGDTSANAPIAMKRALDDAFARFQAAYAGEHPALFANTHLTFQFERVFDGVVTAARIARFFEMALDAIAPSVVVFGLDGFTVERSLRLICARRGISTATLVHGGLSHRRGFREMASDAEHVFVWGRMHAALLESEGVPADRIECTGGLRRRRRAASDIGEAIDARRASTAIARGAKGIAAQTRVITVVTCAINCGLAAPIASAPLHREAWRLLLELARRRKDLTFVVKTHPTYDHYDFLSTILRDGPPNVLFCDEWDLDTALGVADAVVCINYCTTAVLEAMTASIPVVYLRNAVYDIEPNEDPLANEPGVTVGSVPALEARLDVVLERQGAIDAVYQQREILARAFEETSAAPAALVLRTLASIPVSEHSGVSGSPSLANPAVRDLVRGVRERDAATVKQALVAMSRDAKDLLARFALVLPRVSHDLGGMRLVLRTLREVLAERGAADGFAKFARSVYVSAAIEASNRGDRKKLFDALVGFSLSAPTYVVRTSILLRLALKSVVAESAALTRLVLFADKLTRR